MHLLPRHRGRPIAAIQFRFDLGSIAQRRIRAEVAVDVGSAMGAALELAMPVWTPGSYLVREYARHVVRIVAVDGVSGVGLALSKSAKNRYRVELPERCRRVLVRYEVYANALTVREAAVGPEFAFWNGACVYLWPVGAEQEPADVRVELPEGWTLYSGAPVDGGGTFSVSGLDEAVDLPCLAAPDAETIEFRVADRPCRFVAVGLGGVPLPGSLRDDVERVVGCAAQVFDGDVPCDAYTFLALFADKGRGGLEHATSSVLLAPRTTFAPRRSYQEFMSLVAHEFFHVWNAKGMRPRGLVHIDYERENHTELLWVVEGFTAYYDDHLCVRAGIIPAQDYLRIVADHAEAMVKAPGRLEQPLSVASYDAWIRFYRPDENTRNATQNYYSNGALLALCLDARVRDATDGRRSLDDVMRLLWARARPQGYDFELVAACLAEAAGYDLGAELRAAVDEPFEPDLARALAVYGLDAVWEPAEVPTLGLQFGNADTRIASVIDDSAAWRAGLAPGDEVIAVGGLRVEADSWAAVYGQVARDGEPLAVLIARRGRIETLEVTPERIAATRLRITARRDASERALRLREAWLGPTSLALATSG